MGDEDEVLRPAFRVVAESALADSHEDKDDDARRRRLRVGHLVTKEEVRETLRRLYLAGLFAQETAFLRRWCAELGVRGYSKMRRRTLQETILTQAAEEMVRTGWRPDWLRL